MTRTESRRTIGPWRTDESALVPFGPFLLLFMAAIFSFRRGVLPRVLIYRPKMGSPRGCRGDQEGYIHGSSSRRSKKDLPRGSALMHGGPGHAGGPGGEVSLAAGSLDFPGRGGFILLSLGTVFLPRIELKGDEVADLRQKVKAFQVIAGKLPGQDARPFV